MARIPYYTWMILTDIFSHCSKYTRRVLFVNIELRVFISLASDFVLLISGSTCDKGIDLGIIVDRSRSVGKENYIKLKDALKTFLDNFNISEETTHTSLIFFAGEATHLFNLSDSQYHSNAAAKARIDSLSDKLYYGTRTDLALMKAHDHLFENGHDRRKRPNVLVVFTDGQTAAESAPYSETVPPLEVSRPSVGLPVASNTTE